MHRNPVMTDIALVQVHLPSGAATIQGIVRNPDGGPIVAGSLLRRRPVVTGGSDVLLPATAPMGTAEKLDPDRWALADPAIVEVELQRRGWEIISRKEAATLLAEQGYLMRSSTQPGHVLHTDQADAATWHRRGYGPDDGLHHGPGAPGDGADPYLRLAFVVRPVVVPNDLASLPSPTSP
jgi:hypothetical protein